VPDKQACLEAAYDLLKDEIRVYRLDTDPGAQQRQDKREKALLEAFATRAPEMARAIYAERLAEEQAAARAAEAERIEAERAQAEYLAQKEAARLAKEQAKQQERARKAEVARRAIEQLQQAPKPQPAPAPVAPISAPAELTDDQQRIQHLEAAIGYALEALMNKQYSAAIDFLEGVTE